MVCNPIKSQRFNKLQHKERETKTTLRENLTSTAFTANESCPSPSHFPFFGWAVCLSHVTDDYSQLEIFIVPLNSYQTHTNRAHSLWQLVAIVTGHSLCHMSILACTYTMLAMSELFSFMP